jgi:16S rRNA (guanine527-N7)-methyltransferase
MSEFADVLIKGCKELGMTPPPEAAGIYEKYRLFLAEKNRLMNLTAVEGERELAERHFLDSLALLLFADFRGAKVIDVGTGAGFRACRLK